MALDPISIAMALAQFAPAIIKWITGSDTAEGAARDVVGIATRVTGAGSPEEALERIRADSAAQLQFRQAVLANETEMDRLYLADRQSARTRDVELHKAGYRNLRADMMVLLDVLGIVACLVVISLYRDKLPGEVVGILGTIIGIFGACLRDAHQFEFGSSRSSREKDQILAKGF